MSGFIFVRNVGFRFCTKCLVSFLYEMSGFFFVRNVWFRFGTKCRVSFLYEMSGFGFRTNCRAPEHSGTESLISSITISSSLVKNFSFLDSTLTKFRVIRTFFSSFRRKFLFLVKLKSPLAC